MIEVLVWLGMLALLLGAWALLGRPRLRWRDDGDGCSLAVENANGPTGLAVWAGDHRFGDLDFDLEGWPRGVPSPGWSGGRAIARWTCRRCGHLTYSPPAQRVETVSRRG